MPKKPTLVVERVPIGSLTPDPENARKHSQANLDAIAGSLRAFGQRRPLVVWGDVIIAGNGTVEAAKSLGWEDIDVTRVPADWSHDQARAYALADNRTAELAEWDTEILVPVLEELNSLGMLEGTGFSESELNDWRETLDAGVSGDGEGERTDSDGQGDLLAIANISIEDPVHQVQQHDVWKLTMPDSDVTHMLIVSEVMKEWSMWLHYLEGQAVFVPYPDPYITHTTAAHERPLILVQPDHYLAGHVVDKHATAYGEANVERVS